MSAVECSTPAAAIDTVVTPAKAAASEDTTESEGEVPEAVVDEEVAAEDCTFSTAGEDLDRLDLAITETLPLAKTRDFASRDCILLSSCVCLCSQSKVHFFLSTCRSTECFL